MPPTKPTLNSLNEVVEFHDKFVEEHTKSQEALKTGLTNLYLRINEVNEMKAQVANELAIKKAANDRTEESDRQSAAKYQDAVNKQKEADQRLKDLETKEINLKQLEQSLSERNTSIVKSDEDLAQRNRELEQRIKWTEMEERRLKLWQIKINRVIEDKKITEELGKME